MNPAPPVTTYFALDGMNSLVLAAVYPNATRFKSARLRATSISERPLHGSSPSTRRQNHTVLSHSFSTGRLICDRRSSLPDTHHESAPPILLS